MRMISTTLRTRIAILLAIAALITQAILYIPSAAAVDWGSVLRSYNSRNECIAGAKYYQKYYARLQCEKNPDGKTWLLVIMK